MKVLEKLYVNISKSNISKIRLFNTGWYLNRALNNQAQFDFIKCMQ